MPELSIRLHAEGPPEFTTSDRLTVDLVVGGVRQEFAHDLLVEPYRLGAHDLTPIVRYAGRKHWGDVLERDEEATMVLVTVTAHNP